MSARNDKSAPRRHLFPRSDPRRPPSSWWYYGRALYVSRRDYFLIYLAIVGWLGIPLVVLGWITGWTFFWMVTMGLGIAALLYQGYSLLGMFRMYGPPASGYLNKLLKQAELPAEATIADLHVGTYRHSYGLAGLLPEARIHSVDCWDDQREADEKAIEDVRDLEQIPQKDPRIDTLRLSDGRIPLEDASCDAVVMGFGTHEIPSDGTRQQLFREAARVLKPEGRLLMFEHGNDFHNTIIFGPVIGHVTAREQWMKEFAEVVGDIGYQRSSEAVDLFWGTKGETPGSIAHPLPASSRRNATLRILAVLTTVLILSLILVITLSGAPPLWILLGIAVLGLIWPWFMIGVALSLDALSGRFTRLDRQPSATSTG